MEFENIVFIVDGGIGKNLMATVPLRGLKKKYPDKKIIIVCGFPEIFQGNPNVDRVYRFDNTTYFYEDLIKNSKSLVLKPEPYLHPDFIYKNKHCTESWCEMLGVEFDNTKPDYYITQKEIETAQKFMAMRPKPVMLMQISGGPIPIPNQVPPKVLVRDLNEKTAQAVVDMVSKDYHVLLITTPTQLHLNGVEPSYHRIPNSPHIGFTIRELISLIPFAKKSLFIDSFMQHAARAVNQKAVVVWGGTSPKTLGYEENINLVKKVCDNPHCYRPNSYLFDLAPNRTPWECPYGEECMKFSPIEIVGALNGQDIRSG